MRRLLMLAIATLAVLLAARPAQADVVRDWNALLLEVVRVTQPSPPQAARLIAMVNLAVFDSVNAAVALPFQPYSYDGMALRDADPQVAAAAAAAGVIHGEIPDLATRAPGLATRIATMMPAVGNAAEAAGIELGRACAAAILRARSLDGAAQAATAFAGNTAPGNWQPTPPTQSPALLPNWGKVTPFALQSIATFSPPGPPSVGSMPWLDNYNAVKSVGTAEGGSHSRELGDIARFWADDPGSETPPGHWVAIALALSEAHPGSTVETARLFALLGMVLADTGVVTWEAKYRFATWRPITAIREAVRVGNPRVTGDPAWTPVIATPPFPEYPSGHSSFSSGAARVIALFYGRDDIAFDVTSRGPDATNVTRHFERLSDAAEEAGISRVYGGIHFYFAHADGAASGRRIAEHIFATRLLPNR